MFKPNETCFATNENYILRTIGLRFRKIAFYIYFVVKFEPFWS